MISTLANSLTSNSGLAWSMKCSLHEYEDLNLISKNTAKVPEVVAHACHPRVRGRNRSSSEVWLSAWAMQQIPGRPARPMW